MKHTKIEWAHHTVNFWWGCTKVSEACAHCYAETLAKLFSRGKATWGATGARWLRHQRAAEELMKLDASARKRGVRERVFINSMSDTFEDRADLNAARELLWICCCCVPSLDVLLLTKRPENVMRMVPAEWGERWPANVWIGTTVENQAMADLRIPALLQVPAVVRFLSCEPLLGPVDLTRIDTTSDSDPGFSALELRDGDEGTIEGTIGWIICGGESGGNARPMAYAWASSLRDQCRAAGVPFFFKQWGEFVPMPGNMPGKLTTVTGAGRKRRWQQNGDEIAVRIGKKEAGRMFDGVEWNQVPAAAALTGKQEPGELIGAGLCDLCGENAPQLRVFNCAPAVGLCYCPKCVPTSENTPR